MQRYKKRWKEGLTFYLKEYFIKTFPSIFVVPAFQKLWTGMDVDVKIFVEFDDAP